MLEASGILLKGETGRMKVLWLQCGAEGWIPARKARMSTVLFSQALFWPLVITESQKHAAAGNLGVEPVYKATTQLNQTIVVQVTHNNS